LVALVQTPVGKIAAITVFTFLLLLNGEASYLELAVILALLSFFPGYRRPLISLATLYWLLVHPNWIREGLIRKVAAAEGYQAGWGLVLGAAAALAAIFCGVGVLLRIVRTRPSHLLGRRPVLVLVGSFLLLLAAAGTLPLYGWPRVAIWLVLALAGPYLWFFSFALSDRTPKTPDPYRLQFGTFFPFWVGSSDSSTPIGKGGAYLRKVEAHTPKELAVVQLKAIKLLIWLLVLHAVLSVFRAVVYGKLLGVPTLEAALDQTAAGHPLPLHIAWAGVVAHFLDAILAVPIMGNIVVACSRMAGFHLLRNTYKPLYATSIAEFWNRYYFYFKELLVEFFFFPTYIRYFKKHRRLRLAAATFAAATLGNLIFHFCRDLQYVFELGLWPALAGLQVYAFYAVVLGTAIVVSQLRGKRPQGSVPFRRRAASWAGVFGFYCLLEIFDYEGRNHSLRTHLAFFASLFPLAR
jgi:Ca2+/Na+ antiporter